MDNLIEIGALTSLVKLGVDFIKKMAPNDLQPWVLPMAALLLGILFALLLAMEGGVVLTGASIAKLIIQGVFAAGGAVGLTEFHNAVRKGEEL